METLRIEIAENSSAPAERREVCRDTVSVVAQYHAILKDSRCRLRDVFREAVKMLIAGGVLFAVLLALSLLWGFDTFSAVGLVAVGLVVILCAAYLVFLHGMVRTMMKRSGPSAVTLNGEGVEVQTQSTGTLRICWGNVAAVRIFRHVLSFVSADGTGMVLSVSRDHEEEITAWLRENRPGTQVVADG